MSETPEEAFLNKLPKQHQDIIEGIGKASQSWARLETSLFHLYASLAGHKDPRLPGIVFYSPNNFETRFRLVQDLMFWHFEGMAILAHWKKLAGKISTKQGVRNAIMHGAVASSNNESGTQIRLMPQLADTLRLHAAISPRQHPGYSGNDIMGFAQSVDRIVSLVYLVQKIADHLVNNPTDPDPAVAREQLELWTQLSTAIPIQNNHSRSSPDSAPRDPTCR